MDQRALTLMRQSAADQPAAAFDGYMAGRTRHPGRTWEEAGTAVPINLIRKGGWDTGRVESARTPSLHPLLASRWSPASFDETVRVTGDEVDSVLEAARWSPSAGNSQPWAFIVGVRGDATHARLVPYLARSSAAWAATASLLLVNLSHRYVQDTDWEYSEFSLYDLGQAVAHMTIQAQALGLASRQFRAFDRQGLAREFVVPPHWEVTTMTALGRAIPDAGRDSHPGVVERSLRARRSSDHLRWPHAMADTTG